MLTKETPETIKAHLTIKGAGVEMPLVLTYYNRKPKEFKAFMDNPELMVLPSTVKGPRDAMDHVNAQAVLYIVKSFDDGTDKDFPLTYDGMLDLEEHWADVLSAIIVGFHKARGMEIEKN